MPVFLLSPHKGNIPAMNEAYFLSCIYTTRDDDDDVDDDDITTFFPFDSDAKIYFFFFLGKLVATLINYHK